MTPDDFTDDKIFSGAPEDIESPDGEILGLECTQKITPPVYWDNEITQ